jgi:hypothetical protein
MPILYHASTNKDLGVINPKRTLSKDKYIGDFVFATADKVLAIMYLATRGYATLMNSKDTQPNIVVCADQSRYQADDKGGAIYELPEESFIDTPQKELNGYEFVSVKPVKPLSKSVYEKSLYAMNEAGIIIRFVDEQTFSSLIGNPKQAELINNLPIFNN